MSDPRRRILDASVALVMEHGVRGVSFREVARRAGVSHQTPYHHFGDHTGILRAIADEGFASLRDHMQEAVDAAGADPRARLEASGIAYVQFAAAHPGHFRVMFQQQLVGGLQDDDCPPQGRLVPEMVRGLAAAMPPEGGAGHMDADTLALLCWATVHGLANLLVEGGLPDGHGTLPEQLATHVVRSLGRIL
jgi:AcrR family transcriptional regulator